VDDVPADGPGRHRPCAEDRQAGRPGPALCHVSPQAGAGRPCWLCLQIPTRGIVTQARQPQLHRTMPPMWATCIMVTLERSTHHTLMPRCCRLPHHGSDSFAALHEQVGAHGFTTALFTEVAQNYTVPHRPGQIDTRVARHLAGVSCSRSGACTSCLCRPHVHLK